LIQGVFYELTATENYSFSQAYIMLGFFFGLNDRQLRKILLLKPKVALSADDLAKLAVILQRLSEGTPIGEKESEKRKEAKEK